MAENTKIEWATHTFNPWRGCAKVAAGCANCYAEQQSKRNPRTLGVWGPDGSRVVASEAMWQRPVAWNRDASFRSDLGDEIEKNTGKRPACYKARPRIFCGSLCDVFEDWHGQCRMSDRGWCVKNRHMGEFLGYGSCRLAKGNDAVYLNDVRARLFRLIDAMPNLDWLLLTKRPENVRRMWRTPLSSPCVQGDGSVSHDYVGGECRRCDGLRRENVWLGTSIACQEDADRNVSELLKCRDLAAKLFLSIEPLVGPVMLHHWIDEAGQFHASQGVDVDWVIVGGESGPRARPCDIAWIRSIVNQCRDVGVPVFVKQLGAVPECRCDEGGWQRAADGTCNDNSCRRVKLLDPKGGDPAEWPEDLRVREVPS